MEIDELKLIDRLIEILNFKKVGYQNKLKELEKKDRILNILLKYPNNPIKGIIDLSSTDLSNLFTEFMGKNYTKNDVQVMKYWIKEGNNNKALKFSNHYLETIKSFELLLDKMQMFLDYLSDFNIQKKEVITNLNLISSLKDRLINNDLILDLSLYYKIITPNETLLCDQIYEIFTAISSNNLKRINSSINSKEIVVSMNKDIKSYIVSLLENKIEKKEKQKEEDRGLDKSIIAISDLTKKIKDNFDIFIKVYPDTIKKTMEGLWNNDEIDYYINRLAIPVAVIKGKKQGLSLSFCDEDLSIINEFIDELDNKASKITIDNNVSSKRNKIDEEIENFRLIITKLKLSSKNLLDCADFHIIIDILKEEKDYKYIINVINMLNALNLKKSCKEANLENDLEDKSAVNVIAKKRVVTKQEITKMESLLSKYGFNFQAFSPKLIEELIKSSTFEQVEEVAAYISKSKSLEFLKDYTRILGSSALEKELQEIKCSQIFFILAYSNKEILKNFVNISKEDKLDLHDIFSIPKVFASKNNEELSGTYENFIINEKLLKEEYPEILHKIMERYPFILGTDSYLFKYNIELTNLYGMNIIKDSKEALPSPLALTTSNFDYIMDRYIEVQDYDYIECFRYQLETNALAALKIKYQTLKGIDINQKISIDVYDYFDDEIEEYLDNLSIENITLALNESLIKWLDKINEEKDLNKRNIQYILNGIYISRLKVLKYFGTLIINKFEDKKEALLYSIVKDSYLTNDEFMYIKALVEERGGI